MYLFLKGVKRENELGSNQYETKKEPLGPEHIIPYAIGVGSTIQSLLTRYELGAIKKIPMKFHLAADAFCGAFMAASPWIFGFHKRTWIPFVAAGVMELGAALFTKLEPEPLTHKESVIAEYV